MSRLVSAAVLVYDQIDIFSSGITRVTGILASAMTTAVFASNVALSWTVADGTSVLDSAISAGVIYFNEVAGSPGYYSVRFYPDRIGFWRVVLINSGLTKEVILEYDVVASGTLTPTPSNGLNASFL